MEMFTMNAPLETDEHRSTNLTEPVDALDVGLEKIKIATQSLAEHRNGKEFAKKCFACIAAALPVAKLIREDEAARQKMEAAATESKIDVRPHANNRDLLILLKLGQHKVAGAVTAPERNRWATIINHGLAHGIEADDLIARVKRGGINKVASEWAKLDEANAPEMPAPSITLVEVSFTTEFGEKLTGQVPADFAERITKSIRKHLSTSSGDAEAPASEAATVSEAMDGVLDKIDEAEEGGSVTAQDVADEPAAALDPASWWDKNRTKVLAKKAKGGLALLTTVTAGPGNLTHHP
jgi:hypothetical protein